MEKEGVFNAGLRAAVQVLKNKKVIDQDKDIADALDYSKGTVSSYLSGNAKASRSFLRAFEEKYEVSLDEFENSPKDELPGEHGITIKDYIKKIEEHNRFLQNVIANGLLNINQSLQANFDKLHEGQALQEAGQKGWVRVAARLFSGGSKEKETDLLDEMGNIFADVTRPNASSYNENESK